MDQLLVRFCCRRFQPSPKSGSSSSKCRRRKQRLSPADAADDLDLALLLAHAADSAAAQGYRRGNISHNTPHGQTPITTSEAPTSNNSSSHTASSDVPYMLAFTCSKSNADLLLKQDNSSTTEAPLYRLAADGSTVRLNVQYSFSGGTGAAAGVKQEQQQRITELHSLLPELAGGSSSRLAAANDAGPYNRCMLRLGRMFYHVICREAANQPHSTQHQQGLAKSLCALAGRLQSWLVRMATDEPQAMHQLKEELLLQGEHEALLGEPEPLQQPQQQLLEPAVFHGSALSNDSSMCTLGCAAGARSGWSEEVLWWLEHYCLFHTAEPHKYDQMLLDGTVMSLFGFLVHRQQPVHGK
eukprot:gene13176-13307_t